MVSPAKLFVNTVSGRWLFGTLRGTLRLPSQTTLRPDCRNRTGAALKQRLQIFAPGHPPRDGDGQSEAVKTRFGFACDSVPIFADRVGISAWDTCSKGRNLLSKRQQILTKHQDKIAGSWSELLYEPHTQERKDLF